MEWIKYDDKKPTEFGEYLVLKASGRMYVKRYSEKALEICGDGFGTARGSRYDESSVVYWTRLPELPEENFSEQYRIKKQIKELQKRLAELGGNR